MSETGPGLLAIASDHAGFRLKEQLKTALEKRGVRFADLGPADEASVDYPDFAHAVATGVAEGRYGLCESCGDAIAPDRLLAIPETAYCIACGARSTPAGRFRQLANDQGRLT